jgi:predicted  nucleic acid-binding Zn-ribbon protein
VAKLDQKIAQLTKRIPESKAELAKAEASLAEKQKAADAAVQTYQSYLGKQG